MNGYYSVFDPDGKKIADCGIERDAVNLMHTRNKTGMDTTSRSILCLVTSLMFLMANNFPLPDIITVNMDGGVGGSWKFIEV